MESPCKDAAAVASFAFGLAYLRGRRHPPNRSIEQRKIAIFFDVEVFVHESHVAHRIEIAWSAP